MTILLDTPFEIGDEVRHKTDKEGEEPYELEIVEKVKK
jgi:hypothetical protein